jgi:hypothetical protein
MHNSVQVWVRNVISDDNITGKDVLDVGGRDVNGTVRPYIESLNPRSYIAVDMRPGPGVDLVCNAADLDEHADVIICTEMLEHAEQWHAALTGMVNCIRPGGTLLITTRSPGFAKHDHPGDYWRFTLPIMRDALDCCGMNIVRLEDDPEAPGIFALATRPVLANVMAIPVE